jgi:hypothetical protein
VALAAKKNFNYCVQKKLKLISISPKPFQWCLFTFFAAMIVYYQKVDFPNYWK